VQASIELMENKEIFFVIVGDGYLKKDLEDSVAENNNILFLPKINKNQVQHLLSFFDVCFVGRNDTPLFKHGVSANKYFDYMLSSKPILDSNNLIKDPVELSGCGLIVKPDSAEEIKKGIIKLYSHSEEERKMMGSKGLKYVRANHNIRELANRYSKLFSN